MITGLIAFGVVMLLVSASLCLFRVGKGPTAPDRTMAIGTLGTVMVGFCCMMCLMTKADSFMNVAIAWAVISFIASVAQAKHLEGRHFDD